MINSCSELRGWKNYIVFFVIYKINFYALLKIDANFLSVGEKLKISSVSLAALQGLTHNFAPSP
jgi:hypothetical protein